MPTPRIAYGIACQHLVLVGTAGEPKNQPLDLVTTGFPGLPVVSANGHHINAVSHTL